MLQSNPTINSIFDINSEADFNRAALNVFEYQYTNLPIYRSFCDALGRTQPKHYTEIPFLPISFFKTHKILSEKFFGEDLLLFKSSGTTIGRRSQHFVAFPEIYERSFLHTFKEQMSDPKDSIVMALLPNYVQQGESSLVYMVDQLIKESNHPLSGFYLSDPDSLIQAIAKAKQEEKQIILFGVSYALLDFAEKKVDLSGAKILETGGMKGRRKEMIKEELHQILKEGLNVSEIYSEYGMTELLSQAYTDGSEYFKMPQWMRILIRDVNDPFHLLPDGRTGGVNIIDLANYYSCSFIATDDLGVKDVNKFKILGRFDQSDMRGCNLLVN